MNRFMSFVALAVLVSVSWFVLPADSQIVLSPAPAAGGATVGGSDTQVQFNDGGTALGGDAGLTYNKTSNALTVDAVTLTDGNLVGLSGRDILLGVTAASMDAQTIRPVDATADGGNVVGANFIVEAGAGSGAGGASGVLELRGGTFDASGVAFLKLRSVYVSGSDGILADGGMGTGPNASGGPVALSGGLAFGSGSGGGVGLTAGSNLDAGKSGGVVYATGGTAADHGGVEVAGRFLTLYNVGYGEDLTFTVGSASDVVGVSSSTGVLKLDFGTLILEGKHNSSDGTVGLTQTCAAAVTAVTIKDGLITSVTCP